MPRHLIAPLGTLALIALFPLSGATFYVELTPKIMIMAIFALSLDLLVGWTGLVSFGHAAFFGVGAYAFGLALKHIAPNLWLGLAAALVAAALAGGLVAAFILGTLAILRDRNKRIALIGVGGATLAVLLGGTNVQFDSIGQTPFSLGLDWFVISLFF